MKPIIKLSVSVLISVFWINISSAQKTQLVKGVKIENPYYSRTKTEKLNLNNKEWKKYLNEDLYAVARENETERAFTGKYNNFEGVGTYYCAACGNALFKSDAKFATTCGWPGFFEPITKTSVIYKEDLSQNMKRMEVRCGRCDAHLGHLFDDGPLPTGKRYCMNSISLEFEGKKIN